MHWIYYKFKKFDRLVSAKKLFQLKFDNALEKTDKTYLHLGRAVKVGFLLRNTEKWVSHGNRKDMTNKANNRQ